MTLTPQEEKSLKLIQKFQASKEAPAFPVTPIYQIKVPGFDNVWLKDESHNPTGTHKDRMAWEIISVYKEMLINKKNEGYKGTLPSFSIISAGSAAYAIQIQLKKFDLPNLKVLLDISTPKEIVKNLTKIGCDIYLESFENRPLSAQDILTLTKNEDGFDITSNKAFDPNMRFYDWLSYEILNQNPDYVFIPYGTGQVYENIVNINKKIILNEKVDSVFSGDPSKLVKCNFMGSTTNDPKSKAVKLYAPFRPFTISSNEWIKLYYMRGFCGEKSEILEFEERYLNEAIQILNDNNVLAEASAAAGLALMLQIKDKIPREKKMIVLSTGKSKISD